MSAIHAGVISRSNIVFIIGIILLLLAYFFETPPLGIFNVRSSITENTIGIYYKVTKVTDGDTIHINMDGNDEVVRLIGINTPETVDPRRPIQCFGKEATARLQKIVGGEIVRLEYDDSQGLRDSYQRLLAYIYLEDGEMVNRKMIAEGYAYEYTYMTPYKYQKEFRQLQTFARSTERGLWAPATCNGNTAFSD